MDNLKDIDFALSFALKNFVEIGENYKLKESEIMWCHKMLKEIEEYNDDLRKVLKQIIKISEIFMKEESIKKPY